MPLADLQWVRKYVSQKLGMTAFRWSVLQKLSYRKTLTSYAM